MPLAVVTGATGFIGRKLCARLRAEGWRVIAIAGRAVADGPWDACFAADLANSGSVRALDGKLPSDVTVFFHLAGKAHALSELNSDGSEYFQINTEGTRRILELAKACGAERFVLASTVKAMGEGGNELVGEASTCAPETPYGRSKLDAEKILFSEGHVPEPVAIRLTMVYGGKDRGNMTRMVDAVRRRRFPPFPETGNRRSMVHVDDAVQAFLLAATHPAAAGKSYIVTDGSTYSTREIYLTIRSPSVGILRSSRRRYGFFTAWRKSAIFLAVLPGVACPWIRTPWRNSPTPPPTPTSASGRNSDSFPHARLRME